jgi:hypothetical protein
VELLLRDIYGDDDILALNLVQSALSGVASALTEFLRKDLWQEHADAMLLDWYYAPNDEGITGSDFRSAMVALASLTSRVLEVDADPSAFGEYTVEFAKHVREHWDIRPDPEFLRVWARPSPSTAPEVSGWSGTPELEALLIKGT